VIGISRSPRLVNRRAWEPRQAASVAADEDGVGVSRRESAEARGCRYVAEGRLTVEHVDGDAVHASCRGSGALHCVGWDRARGWWCSCPARTRCAHLRALQLVTVREANAA
jgi:hypothetical protein